MGEVRHITRFVDGERLFASTGASVLRVTRDGAEEYLSLPIKSIGVVELQDEMSRGRPKAPVRKDLIKKGSDEGRKLGLGHDAFVTVLDEADEEYQAKLAAWNEETTWRLILLALDVEFTDREGNPIADPKAKRQGLINAGITADHIAQLSKDIRALTERAEVEADFLSGTP